MEYGSAGFLVSSAKAQQVLGWQPLVSRSRAMDLTLEWVQICPARKIVSHHAFASNPPGPS